MSDDDDDEPKADPDLDESVVGVELSVASDAEQEAPDSSRREKLEAHATRIYSNILLRVAASDPGARRRLADSGLLQLALSGKLTIEQRRRIGTGARAELGRRSLFRFLKMAWPILESDTPFESNWHHEMLCHHLQCMLQDWLAKKKNPAHRMRVQNAIFNFPPGTTKSRIISVMVMAWMWLHRPTWSVLCLSANPNVATRDATLSRDLVSSDWYRTTFGITWKIREDIDAKTNYKNSVGGWRVSTGITSRVVGQRADCLLIDDPNDMDEVFHETIRRQINGRIDNSLWNRVNDQRHSLRLMLQQRGHMDDATGHLLRKLGTDTRKVGAIMHVPVPMEFDPNLRVRTPFGYRDPRTKAGELLQASRFTAEFLASERVRLGTYAYDAQMNQRAELKDGNKFKRPWFRFFTIGSRPNEYAMADRPLGCVKRETLPAFILRDKGSYEPHWHWTQRLDLDWMLITVDATFGSLNDEASQVGLLVFGGKGATRFLFDDRTDVMDFDDMCKAIEDLRRDYPAARRVIVENKANGAAIVQTMGKRFPGFIAVDPKGGKIARAQAMQPAVEACNLYLLDGAIWMTKYVDEMCVFPRGVYDDRVDATSQMMTYAEENLGTVSDWQALSS